MVRRCLGVLSVMATIGLVSAAQDAPSQAKGRWELVVLGIAQDAGIPHLGCKQELCRSIRDGKRKPERVSSLGLVNRTLGSSYLFDATPDMRVAAPRSTAAGRRTAIFLTHAHIGHYTGLMYFGRESLDAKACRSTAPTGWRRSCAATARGASSSQRSNIDARSR